MTSLFFLELLFRHLMRFDDLPIAGGVEFQREKKSRFQLARRSPITRRVHDRRSCVGPFAQLHNVPFWCAMARVKMLWQMAFAELHQLRTICFIRRSIHRYPFIAT